LPLASANGVRGSSQYSSYYRPMLPKPLAALEFRCNNTAYRPVMDAPELLGRYAGRERTISATRVAL
jgi:hypothetical protein